mmetsp:Transcript_87/g.150  ORF Transcript_87/g.150 Transcript_87/m.150 type:complete len:80 (+) Transcript_87:143-382(+)
MGSRDQPATRHVHDSGSRAPSIEHVGQEELACYVTFGLNASVDNVSLTALKDFKVSYQTIEGSNLDADEAWRMLRQGKP